MKKQLLSLMALAGITLSAPVDAPIEPWDYQKMLGHGFDVAWAEFNVKIEGYGVDELAAMNEHKFKTARIRTNLPADQALFDILDIRIQDCLDSGIVPILAYQGGPMEADPSAVNQALAVEWWRTVAQHYADYSHKLAFNIVVEWTDLMSKDASLINGFYEQVAPVIRESNPDRIVIFSPKRISNPEYLDSMVIPTSAGNYVMAEWHFYAAGPSSDPTSAKYWTTGTPEQKQLILNKVKFATDWSAKTNIPTWVGAWMAGNYNKGNTTPMATQVQFADYMVSVLDSVQIPWCINTIDKFYDYTTNMWIDSMAELRDTIDGISGVAEVYPCTLTVSAEAGGTISPSGTIVLNSGDNQAFTITPEAGYSILDVQVDGKSVGAVANYTLTGISKNSIVTATFVKDGTIALSTLLGGETVIAGEPVAINWSGTVTDPVVVELLNSDVVIDTLTTSGANGSFSWTPADSLKGLKTLKISISSGSLSDTSDTDFSVAGDQVSVLKKGTMIEHSSVQGIRNGALTLSIARAGSYAITLFSLSGRVIATQNISLSEGAHSIDFGTVPHGITIVQISGVSGSSVYKVTTK